MVHKIKIDNGSKEREVYTTGQFELWGYEFLIRVDTDTRELIYCASEKTSGYLGITCLNSEPEKVKKHMETQLIKLFKTRERAKSMLQFRIERAIITNGGISDGN